MTASIRGELRAAIVIGHLGHGGAERQLTELALRAPAQGVAPHVFCLGGTDEPYGSVLRAHGVPVTVVRRRGGFDLRRALELAAWLRREPVHLIHSFLIDTNPYAFLAARLAGIGVLVASNRNTDFPRGRLRSVLDGLVFRRASAIVVNAQAVRNFTARRFRVPAERLTVIYNGVDLECFRPRARTNDEPLTIGTIGALSPKKNPELFARVCSAARGRYSGVRCLHVGDGPLREALASKYRGMVEFLGPSDSAQVFLSGLDVFVLTSDREGCPNVLLEAMACGRVVVTTDAGGCREVVLDGQTGYVTPRGDMETTVRRVCDLLGNPELRRRMGMAARAHAESRFSVGRMVEETVDLYQSVVCGEQRYGA